MEPEKNSVDFKDRVLKRLEQECVSPTSKWYWRSVEFSLWLMWGLSVLFGALSVAILLYAGTHNWYGLYEATHGSPVSFWIEMLPHLWLLVFLAMTMLAYINFRCTRHGYRYPIVRVLISSLIFSIAGGFAFYVVGAGGSIDTKLGKVIPLYESQEEMQLKHWQSPQEGRLVGHMIDAVATTTDILFVDIDDMIWILETAELRPVDQHLLKSGKQVRIMGVSSTTAEYLMRACGVFTWMFNTRMTLKDFKQERAAFLQKLAVHRSHGSDDNVTTVASREEKMAEQYCQKMPVIKQLEEKIESMR